MKKVAMILGHDFLEPTLDFRVYREARTLIDAGYKVTVYCWARRIITKKSYFEYKGITIKRIHEPLTIGFISQFRTHRRAMFRLGKMVINDQPNIIHAHDLEVLPYAIKANNQINAIMIFDSHEDWPLLEWVQNRIIGTWMAFQQKRCMKKVDVLLTSSPNIAKYFSKAEVLYNSELKLAIKRNLKTSIELNKLQYDEFIIGYIGGLRQSLVDELFNSINNIKNIHLLIVGGPPKGRSGYNNIKHYINNQAMKKGLRISFVGTQPYSKMGNYYRACDIIIVGHYVPKMLRAIAVPKKLLDAMAYGKPVLVGPYSARQKIVKDHTCGKVSTDFNKSINKLITNKNERYRFGLNGISAFINYYCWDKQSAKLLIIYKEITQV